MGLNGIFFERAGSMKTSVNIAKVLNNGMITVPVEIRRLLGVKQGDRILFFLKHDGEIVVRNAIGLLRDDGTDE